MAIHSPLSPLLNEINKAANGGLPFIAVAMTVALPDICVSLASADGRTDAVRYKQWCRDNLNHGFDFLTPDDLYSMRCGVLHNGRFGDMRHSIARVVFVTPESGITYVNNVFNDAYIYSVVDFCRNFTGAVHQWMEQHLGDAMVQANLPRLMQYRQGGLKPYIDGPTVLA